MMKSAAATASIPKLSAVIDEDQVLKFRLHPINVAYANALRRVLLSDITVCAIRTESEAVNQCRIAVNTTRFHNEIVKHRLSCIPVHMDDPEQLVGKYVLEVNVKNETEDVMYVTTEQFRVRNVANGHYLTREETAKIFPPASAKCGGGYIDFVRLRPQISDTIPGEAIQLEADFSVATAKTNSMFNVVALCTYGNTVDGAAAGQAWEKVLAAKIQAAAASGTTLTKDETAFEKRNFELLDAQRYCVPDSFDFQIESVGVYDNRELMRKACAVLQNRFLDVAEAAEGDTVPIVPSETTIANCYDAWLENEDYTVGRVLEYILYERFYQGDQSLTFCGFKKFHPHDTKSTLRLAFASSGTGAAEDEPTAQQLGATGGRSQVRHYLKVAATEAAEVFAGMYKLF
jgi:DNA-directed RNA polymerase subunit L